MMTRRPDSRWPAEVRSLFERCMFDPGNFRSDHAATADTARRELSVIAAHSGLPVAYRQAAVDALEALAPAVDASLTSPIGSEDAWHVDDEVTETSAPPDVEQVHDDGDDYVEAMKRRSREAYKNGARVPVTHEPAARGDARDDDLEGHRPGTDIEQRDDGLQEVIDGEDYVEAMKQRSRKAYKTTGGGRALDPAAPRAVLAR